MNKKTTKKISKYLHQIRAVQKQIETGDGELLQAGQRLILKQIYRDGWEAERALKIKIDHLHYLSGLPNIGLPTRQEVEKQIEPLKKRKRISAKHKQELADLEAFHNTYAKVFENRMQEIQNCRAYDKLERVWGKKKEALQTKDKKSKDACNTIFHSASAEDRREIEKLSREILYGG